MGFCVVRLDCWAMREASSCGMGSRKDSHAFFLYWLEQQLRTFRFLGILSEYRYERIVYKITWDKETGGVLLHSRIVEGTLGISPRPVFYEELDLLGLNKLGWDYPHCDAPIMWAINKQYWYRGEHIFDAKGANIYTKPTLEFCKGIEPQKLIPVDVDAMLRKTSDYMFVLENEAIEFIRDTYTAYSKVNKTFDKADANKMDFEAMAERVEKKSKQKMAVVKQDCESFDIMPLEAAQKEGKRVLLSTKIDRFIASFSGGKDSQVVLDLCTRAIPPTDFEVIYSDTGYELPPSLSLYEEIQKYYKDLFPALKFHTARNHESVLNYWDKIGTPSDTHRWCCSVMKTAPLYRALLSKGQKQRHFIAFEGVRAEESVKRSDYNRIGKGVKHRFVVNARPILLWNTTEVFLYLFGHDLPINSAYRVGKPRVGCILCPFGSPWDDMIVNNCYHSNLKPFLSRLENMVEERNIPNKEEYISERKWKMRGSGKFSDSLTSIVISTSSTKWEAKVSYSQKDVLTWLSALGKYSVKYKGNQVLGELSYKDEVFNFSIDYQSKINDYRFILYDNNNIQLRYLIRRVIYKSAYCINCESCELECPTGALSVYPDVSIETTRCIHCHKCLEYHDVGCIVADSLLKPTVINTSNMKISKYGTFGIHQEWVDQYLSDPESFWKDNYLGVKQVPSFKAWLKDAEIIDENVQITEFGDLCVEINRDSPTLLWELIHINLTYNSPLMRWFVSTFGFTNLFDRKGMDRLASEYFQPAFKETTIKYAVQALVQTFKYSPIGEELKQFESQDQKGLSFMRLPYSDLSPEAVAYSLYKYGKTKQISMLRVSDLYREEEGNGVYKEFGIARNDLLKLLRYLSSDSNRVLIAELSMGLEHITLREDLTPVLALKSLL